MTDPRDEAELDRISELLSTTTPEAEAFFVERRRLGLGVGLDEHGRFVYARDLLAEQTKLPDTEWEASKASMPSPRMRAALSKSWTTTNQLSVSTARHFLSIISAVRRAALRRGQLDQQRAPF